MVEPLGLGVLVGVFELLPLIVEVAEVARFKELRCCEFELELCP